MKKYDLGALLQSGLSSVTIVILVELYVSIFNAKDAKGAKENPRT